MKRFKPVNSTRVVLFGLLFGTFAQAQIRDESASGLIDFLTYQSGRTKPSEDGFNFSCQVDFRAIQDRRAYDSLIRLGSAAMPALERYLDSLQHAEDGDVYVVAYNSQWVLYAYAKVAGRAALPRFFQMARDPKLLFLRLSLANSFALALDLTGYVSRLSHGAGVLCRPRQPRDGLNQIIVAWEEDDRTLFEASLGQHAQAALHSMLEGQTWASLRGGLFPKVSRGRFAVGYRFDAPGPWSVPEAGSDSPADAGSNDSPELETKFKNRDGEDCGSYRVQFLRIPSTQPGVAPYLVDNRNLADLLRTISSCAAQ